MSWDKFLLELAEFYCQRSKDPSTKVGAVIADDRHVVVGMGYNGFPRGVDDSPERYADRTEKYPRVVHAELNAILNANGPVRGCTLYVTLAPCSSCTAAIIQSGIRRVVVKKFERWDEEEEGRLSRWELDWQMAESMFTEAGVEVEYL